MDAMHVLDGADAALCELVSYCGPGTQLGRCKPALAAEVRRLCERLISRVALLSDLLLVPHERREGFFAAFTERWRSTDGDGLALTRRGTLMERVGPLGEWTVVREGATLADLHAMVSTSSGKSWAKTWAENYNRGPSHVSVVEVDRRPAA